MFRGASVRSTATRTDELEIGLAAKQETDTLISSGTNKNRRTCGDSVKKDRRESKGERRQEQARVNPARLAMVKAEIPLLTRRGVSRFLCRITYRLNDPNRLPQLRVSSVAIAQIGTRKSGGEQNERSRFRHFSNRRAAVATLALFPAGGHDRSPTLFRFLRSTAGQRRSIQHERPTIVHDQ